VLRLVSLFALVLATVAASGAFAGTAAKGQQKADEHPTAVSLYATGLYNPRGMTFGPDKVLYVAEAGPPGKVTVPLPVNFGGHGPIGNNAAIAKILPGGGRAKPFVTGLPNIGLYGGVEMLGAADVAFYQGRLYEIAAGDMTVLPKLSRVTPDGKMIAVANIGKFNNNNPPTPANGDAVPGGNPFGLVALGDHLYISDGNYNRIIQADPKTGKLRIFATFDPDPTSTGLTVAPNGKEMYLAQYGTAPYIAGSSRVDTISSTGKWTKGVLTGLTTPIATAFAKNGTMYVLEYAQHFNSAKKLYVPNTGILYRIGKDGSQIPVVTHLMFPTSMVFGPNGALYITDYGNESNFGEGEVLSVVPGDTAVVAPHVPLPRVHGSYDVPTLANVATGKAIAGATKINIVEPQQVLKWGYSPNVVHVKVGQKIVFTNTGLISHTATASNGAFDTGLISHNQSSVVVINKPGIYKFFCTPHPWMKGEIVVTGKASGAQAAAAPVDKPNPPSLNWVVVVLVVGGILVGVFAFAYFTRRTGQ
jgi:plastocyanin